MVDFGAYSYTYFLGLVFDEGIRETVAGLPIANDLTLFDLAKPSKDDLERILLGQRIELANEQHILWRRSSLDIGYVSELRSVIVAVNNLLPPSSSWWSSSS